MQDCLTYGLQHREGQRRAVVLQEAVRLRQGGVQEEHSVNTVEHGMVSAPPALRYVRAASSWEAELSKIWARPRAIKISTFTLM